MKDQLVLEGEHFILQAVIPINNCLHNWEPKLLSITAVH